MLHLRWLERSIRCCEIWDDWPRGDALLDMLPYALRNRKHQQWLDKGKVELGICKVVGVNGEKASRDDENI